MRTPRTKCLGCFYRMHWKWQDGERRAIARVLSALPENPRAVKLVERTDPRRYFLITRSAYPSEHRNGDWQATRIDELGPVHHFNAPTIEAAVRSLLGQHVPGIGLPYGSPKQYRFDSAR